MSANYTNQELYNDIVKTQRLIHNEREYSDFLFRALRSNKKKSKTKEDEFQLLLDQKKFFFLQFLIEYFSSNKLNEKTKFFQCKKPICKISDQERDKLAALDDFISNINNSEKLAQFNNVINDLYQKKKTAILNLIAFSIIPSYFNFFLDKMKKYKELIQGIKNKAIQYMFIKPLFLSPLFLRFLNKALFPALNMINSMYFNLENNEYKDVEGIYSNNPKCLLDHWVSSWKTNMNHCPKYIYMIINIMKDENILYDLLFEPMLDNPERYLLVNKFNQDCILFNSKDTIKNLIKGEYSKKFLKCFKSDLKNSFRIENEFKIYDNFDLEIKPLLIGEITNINLDFKIPYNCYIYNPNRKDETDKIDFLNSTTFYNQPQYFRTLIRLAPPLPKKQIFNPPTTEYDPLEDVIKPVLVNNVFDIKNQILREELYENLKRSIQKKPSPQTFQAMLTQHTEFISEIQKHYIENKKQNLIRKSLSKFYVTQKLYFYFRIVKNRTIWQENNDFNKFIQETCSNDQYTKTFLLHITQPKQKYKTYMINNPQFYSQDLYYSTLIQTKKIEEPDEIKKFKEFFSLDSYISMHNLAKKVNQAFLSDGTPYQKLLKIDKICSSSNFKLIAPNPLEPGTKAKILFYLIYYARVPNFYSNLQYINRFLTPDIAPIVSKLLNLIEENHTESNEISNINTGQEPNSNTRCNIS